MRCSGQNCRLQRPFILKCQTIMMNEIYGPQFPLPRREAQSQDQLRVNTTTEKLKKTAFDGKYSNDKIHMIIKQHINNIFFFFLLL